MFKNTLYQAPSLRRWSQTMLNSLIQGGDGYRFQQSKVVIVLS
jgi:hypothetical protein